MKKRESHGLGRSTEHAIWSKIKRRCFVPEEPNYHRYGGRGISMCDEWKDSFLAFYRDMGSRPSKLHSIERNDNFGHYCKENCRWATATEQANNRRTNVFVTLPDGSTKTIKQLSRIVGIKSRTIEERIKKGFDYQRIIAPPRPTARKY